MRSKPLAILIGVGIAAGVAVFFGALGITSGLVHVGDDFFAALERGDFEGAYEYLSAEFHGNTTVAELRSFAQESALANYDEAIWWQRTVSGDVGYLDGEVETKTGDCVPVSITFQKENGEWKIYQIDW